MMPKWDEEGYDFVKGKWILPNGWSFEDYNRNRRIIAREIMALQKLAPEDG